MDLFWDRLIPDGFIQLDNMAWLFRLATAFRTPFFFVCLQLNGEYLIQLL